jgi:adenylate cyclase
MIAALEAINAEITGADKTRAGLEIKIGIGLNSGDCVVGNMGSQTRFDYSVLGDAVNIASRLEGATKTYNKNIIFGVETYEALKVETGAVELGTIQVKGRAAPLAIYTVQ